MFAGFTKTVGPSSATNRSSSPGSSRSRRRTVRHAGWGMPSASSTVFAIALSMATAEPSTPDPT